MSHVVDMRTSPDRRIMDSVLGSIQKSAKKPRIMVDTFSLSPIKATAQKHIFDQRVQLLIPNNSDIINQCNNSKSKTMNDNPDVSGLLYKKRGGFGKMMPNAWQFRFFTISKDGILSYYDTDTPDAGVFESKARGKLDLKGTNCDLILDPIEGAPTPYSILLSPRTEEKWRLCAENKEDYTRWIKSIEKFIDKTAARVTVSSPYSSDDEAAQNRKAAASSKSNKDSTESMVTPLSSPRNATLPKTALDAAPEVAQPQSKVSQTKSTTHGHRRRLKLGNKADIISSDSAEAFLVLLILNICFWGVYCSVNIWRRSFFLAAANAVVARTLQLRAKRASHTHSVAAAAGNVVSEKLPQSATESAPPTTPIATDSAEVSQSVPSDSTAIVSSKPTPGFTFQQVFTEPRLSPAHTWCRVDHRQFNVRVGPDYNRYKKKAASGPPIYEPFAVDVFCTKKRVDHAATRFQLPDTSNINTHHEFVPPIVIVQIQIPSEPPTSIFSSAEDGPGWAIVMYYRISEDACNQLKDFATASPAVKLFADWCEKAPVDAAWRGRFKVINSCTNLEELGMPSAIVAYNAKPVLIRRTGTIFRGPNYLEMNIHVHKFANLAKQSIYLISSRCGLMFMQIGFVIEGREDKELPEAMFACVAVNKPQEDQAEFIFEDGEE